MASCFDRWVRAWAPAGSLSSAYCYGDRVLIISAGTSESEEGAVSNYAGTAGTHQDCPVVQAWVARCAALYFPDSMSP